METTITHDEYGIPEGTSMDHARVLIEQVLNTTFVLHESSYLGLYFLAKIGKEQLQLRFNFDPDDRLPVRKEIETTGLILYVNSTQRPDEIQKSLKTVIPSIQLLKRSDYPKKR